MHNLVRNQFTSRMASEPSLTIAQIREIVSIVNQITSGNVEFTVSEKLQKSELGSSLLAMRISLQTLFKQEEEREWLSEGVAFMNDLFRNSERALLSSLLNRALIDVARRVNAFQGSVFSIFDGENENLLERVAAYAVERQEKTIAHVPLGAGLVGQCVLEKSPVFLTDIPPGYVKITSGLGECEPKSILITPLVYRNVSVGAIELAFLHVVKSYERDLVFKCAEIMASAMTKESETAKTQRLLSLAESQAEKLRVKEQLLQQHLEEMQTMQEQLARNETELKEKLAALEIALEAERRSEISRIKEEEKLLLESKLETQRNTYELIIERLKRRLENLTIKTN